MFEKIIEYEIHVFRIGRGRLFVRIQLYDYFHWGYVFALRIWNLIRTSSCGIMNDLVIKEIDIFQKGIF